MIKSSETPAMIVRQARRKSGMTQNQFAHILNKDQSLISKYEQGKVTPPGETIMHCMHIIDSRQDEISDASIDDLIREIRLRLSSPSKASVRRLFMDLIQTIG